ncbi:MAG TPA: ABC transporter substrate-binding protein [Chloroflexota bacterium]|nr:ABC transporter substrate-binding protein [Chloroflexota bacterium]
MLAKQFLALGAGLALLASACGGTAAPSAAPVSSPAAAASAAAKPSTAAASSGTASANAKPAASAAASAAAKPAGGTATIKYGLPTSSPAITTVGVYFALDNGFFKDAGLDVQVTPYNGSVTAIRALLSREADVVETGGDTTYLARSSGAPVKIVDSPVDRGTDSVVVSKSINSFKDLAGKSYAIANPNDTTHVAAKILATKAGIDPNKIDFVAIGGPADRAKALLAGKVDGTSLTTIGVQPILDAIDKGDVHVLTTLAKEFPDLPLAYDITRDDLVSSQSATLQKFVTANIKGYRWAQQNPDKAATIAGKYIQGMDPAILARGMKSMVDLGVWGLDGGFTMDGLDRTQKLLIDQGTLKQAIKPDEVATTQFIDAANKELGPVK